MKKLQLYYIDDDYINYLRKFDSRVFYNKKSSRPYVGVVLECNNFTYFAPLASPKPKHLKLDSNAWDIFKIANGNLGLININNMIPTPKACLSLVLPTITDIKYKNLLQNQLKYLNLHQLELYTKVNHFYDFYQKGYLDPRIVLRTCNFPLLETKCLEYAQKMLIKN